MHMPRRAVASAREHARARERERERERERDWSHAVFAVCLPRGQLPCDPIKPSLGAEILGYFIFPIILLSADHFCIEILYCFESWSRASFAGAGSITRNPGEDIVTPMKATAEAKEQLAKIAADAPAGGGPGEAPTAEMLATQIEVPLRAGDALFFHSLTGVYVLSTYAMCTRCT